MLYHVDLLAQVFASVSVPIVCIVLQTAFIVLFRVLLVANCIHRVILFAWVGRFLGEVRSGDGF